MTHASILDIHTLYPREVSVSVLTPHRKVSKVIVQYSRYGFEGELHMRYGYIDGVDVGVLDEDVVRML